jgi:hypothetical protein
MGKPWLSSKGSLFNTQVKVGALRIMLPCIPQLERPCSHLWALPLRDRSVLQILGPGFDTHGRSAAPVEEQAIRVLMLSLGDLALTSGTPA